MSGAGGGQTSLLRVGGTQIEPCWRLGCSCLGGPGALFGFAIGELLGPSPTATLLSRPRSLPRAPRVFGGVEGRGSLAAESLSISPSVPLPQSIQSPQVRGSGKKSGCLFPAVPSWKVDSGGFLVGAGRPEARRPGGRKGVGGEAPRVRSCYPGEKLRENCDPETPFTDGETND